MNRTPEVAFRVGLVFLVVVPAAIGVYFQWKAIRTVPAPPPPDPEFARREGRLTLMTVPVSVAVTVLVLLCALNPRWVQPLTIPIPDKWRWFALLTGLVSVLGGFEVHRRTYAFWSRLQEIREGHDLVTTGPYRFVRHPSTSVRTVRLVALTVLSANWLLVILSAITIAMRYYRIRRVEARLMERFGDQYRDYMRKTGKLLPRLLPRA